MTEDNTLCKKKKKVWQANALRGLTLCLRGSNWYSVWSSPRLCTRLLSAVIWVSLTGYTSSNWAQLFWRQGGDILDFTGTTTRLSRQLSATEWSTLLQSFALVHVTLHLHIQLTYSSNSKTTFKTLIRRFVHNFTTLPGLLPFDLKSLFTQHLDWSSGLIQALTSHLQLIRMLLVCR